jgi:hypothetical protein
MYVTRSTLTSWQEEYASSNRLPTIASTLALFLSVAAVLLALLSGPQATADGRPQYREPPPCATVWPPTCEQTGRR